jgi:hypothetical protein
MKITGSTSAGPIGARSGAQPVAGGFAPISADEAHGAAASSPAGGLTGVASLDALLALQEAGGPLERRRRAVSRAGRMLDMLDEIKLALLDDTVPAQTALQRLQSAVRESRQATDDIRLEGVLDEIETRAAVELAKQEVALAA